MKLAESSILVEFVADLFPGTNLLPQDPVLRAQTRFFVDVVSSKFVPAYMKFVVRGEGYEDLLAAVEAIQDILPATGTYAMGEQYTIADISITPFIARLKFVSSNELGRYPVGQGKELLQTLNEPRYAKFSGYAECALDRQSFQTTFDVVRCSIKGSRTSSAECFDHPGTCQRCLYELVWQPTLRPRNELGRTYVNQPYDS